MSSLESSQSRFQVVVAPSLHSLQLQAADLSGAMQVPGSWSCQKKCVQKAHMRACPLTDAVPVGQHADSDPSSEQRKGCLRKAYVDRLTVQVLNEYLKDKLIKALQWLPRNKRRPGLIQDFRDFLELPSTNSSLDPMPHSSSIKAGSQEHSGGGVCPCASGLPDSQLAAEAAQKEPICLQSFAPISEVCACLAYDCMDSSIYSMGNCLAYN
ncbi:hypothetical protein WJX84_008762 [Apatococcus fuscideae]|uniref:Uncharacterized protein n=1 Tax=Apatococcus fuscideae TaxID=2026836 RepID=A0AAW1S999_9CHLO